MSMPADPAELLVPLLAAVIHPATASSAIILSFLARSRWWVRGLTAAVAAAIGFLDTLGHAGILHGTYIVASSALGGLLVAEAVLVVLAPLLAALFGLAAVIVARFRAPR